MGVSDPRTLQMRLNHALYRFSQLAREQRANTEHGGKYTRLRFEYCAFEIEKLLRILEKELAEIEWVEVD